MFKLWCAGKLGNCPQGLTRFRFTCLYCRWRRRYYGKFVTPSYWIEYMLTARAWNPVRILKIDPRGHFTMLRCSVIVALDKIMRRCTWLEKPLLEFCEFLSNYPTF